MSIFARIVVESTPRLAISILSSQDIVARLVVAHLKSLVAVGYWGAMIAIIHFEKN